MRTSETRGGPGRRAGQAGPPSSRADQWETNRRESRKEEPVKDPDSTAYFHEAAAAIAFAKFSGGTFDPTPGLIERRTAVCQTDGLST